MATKKIISDSLKIFKRSVNAALPDELVRRNVKYEPTLDRLTVAGDTVDLNGKHVHLIGAGKAVKTMAQEMERLLGSRIKSGIVSVPHGSLERGRPGRVQYSEGAKNNLPDAEAELTSMKIKELASALRADDVLIVLISGGGSALLTLPSPPIKLEEKFDLVRKLANAGADIKELNTVRKKLSQLKGGRLAALAHPADVVTLILSDIVGDPLDLIASGPTVQNDDPPTKAKDIIDKYELFDSLPESIRSVLLQGAVQAHSIRARNYIIGSNRLSLDAALQEAASLNYPALVVSSRVVGDVSQVARDYISLAKCLADLRRGRISCAEAAEILGTMDFVENGDEFLKSVQGMEGSDVCLIMGGETTVLVRGTGRGGRNQHLALLFAKLLHDNERSFCDVRVHLLCAGTDGIDGPTDAAGAIAHDRLYGEAQSRGLDVEQYLTNNDSYTFYSSFRGGELHVMTGHTGTNVMDVNILMLSFADR